MQTNQLFTHESSAFGAFQVGESPGYLALLILPWGERFVRNDDGVDWIVNADTENIYKEHRPLVRALQVLLMGA